MEIEKIPQMDRKEYDQLIIDEYVCRIAFKGSKEHPYIAPFLYVFDGKHMYFLSTKYGKKIEFFKHDPNVSVEVDRYSRDLSDYSFVTLLGRLVEVKDENKKKNIREKFVQLIKDKNLSKNILKALGHLPEEPLDSIVREERNYVWKLIDVKEIIALKKGT
jgi:nitroimidazol reductase NimA-like FMN-containing flavoprotein (pyridoxamine 5'-phosphate oxidase superfamily)